MSYDITFNVCVPSSLNGFAFSFAPFKKIISRNLGSLLEWDSVCLIFSLTYIWLMALQVCQGEKEKVEGKMLILLSLVSFFSIRKSYELCFS